MGDKELIINERLKDVQLMKTIAITAVFTALVFAVTAIFYVNLASSGYFNVGETMVYLSALIGGPLVGAIAGGIGSALADASLGFYKFVPATLILKGAEGFLAGYLFQISKKTDKKIRYLVSGVVIIALIGLSSWLATTPLIIGFTIPFKYSNNEYTFSLPSIIILIAAILLSILVIVTMYFFGEKGKMVFSCITAGPIIVVGYFLYELATMKWLDTTFEQIVGEIPFNIMQVLIGVAFAVPIAVSLQKMGVLENINSRVAFAPDKEAYLPFEPSQTASASKPNK